jgi:hypothetical protein
MARDVISVSLMALGWREHDENGNAKSMASSAKITGIFWHFPNRVRPLFMWVSKQIATFGVAALLGLEPTRFRDFAFDAGRNGPPGVDLAEAQRRLHPSRRLER